jgi:hypothetical protein
MSAANLGVCVGPSLLWAHTPTPASSRAIPSLVELLIVRCELLLGPHVPLLLGDPPERDPTRQDSGAEESDSLHCESQIHTVEILNSVHAHANQEIVLYLFKYHRQEVIH